MILPTSAGSYSTGHWMTTCGADGGHTEPEILEFGFVARGLAIVNTCADPLYFSLTTDPASTSSATIPGGGTLPIQSLWTAGLSLATTSTTTGASLPLGRPRAGVVAWSA